MMRLSVKVLIDSDGTHLSSIQIKSGSQSDRNNHMPMPAIGLKCFSMFGSTP